MNEIMILSNNLLCEKSKSKDGNILYDSILVNQARAMIYNICQN